MKSLVLAGSVLIAITVSPLVAEAEPIVFDYTGSLVPFTVPTTGTYQILAWGAQGGQSIAPLGSSPGKAPPWGI
jgi:hypothetical protein